MNRITKEELAAMLNGRDCEHRPNDDLTVIERDREFQANVEIRRESEALKQQLQLRNHELEVARGRLALVARLTGLLPRLVHSHSGLGGLVGRIMAVAAPAPEHGRNYVALSDDPNLISVEAFTADSDEDAMKRHPDRPVANDLGAILHS